MRINHNISALNAYRLNDMNQFYSNRSMEKLSSGLRINRAGDDAAGLAISEKMRGQIRGLVQASTNAQNAISMVQTAEGGMGEIHALLQRGRELSVQAANDTLTSSDREKIQAEIDQIVEEVDRIANTTEYNTIKLLNVKNAGNASTNKEKTLQNMLRSSLEQSEKRIKEYFGLEAENANITFDLDWAGDGAGGTLAQVSASVPSTTGGTGSNITMHIDMADFTPPPDWPNGGSLWINNDRIIAHEMVHAVMDATVNVGNPGGSAAIPKWFSEGAAEFLAGGDERLKTSVAGAGSASSLLSGANQLGTAWGGTSNEYSTAYAGVKYLHEQIKNAGGSGIKDIFTYLKADPVNRTLDDAIQNSLGMSLSTFESDFNTNGDSFINSLDLNNEDVGAIGGFDTDGGVVLNNDDVIADIDHLTDDPLTGFNEIYANSMDIDKITGKNNNLIRMQIGANQGISIGVAFSNVTSARLGLSEVDVTTHTNAEAAIKKFDDAIQQVSSERARLGAMQNHFEAAVAVNDINVENTQASESRIRDVNMAKEMMNFTKSNILSQTSQAMLAQANQKPQMILQLLQ